MWRHASKIKCQTKILWYKFHILLWMTNIHVKFFFYTTNAMFLYKVFKPGRLYWHQTVNSSSGYYIFQMLACELGQFHQRGL